MTLRILAVGTLFTLLAPFAFAGVTTVNFASGLGKHHLAQFDGTATYDSVTGKLTMDVNNTTASANGGFLTALALSATGPAAAFNNAPSAFIDLRNPKGVVKAPPFGRYHAGAGIGGRWSGGGDASQGVAGGASQEFVFDATAPGATAFTAADFLTPGKTGQEIVASFRKLKGRHQDRAGAVMTGSVRVVSASDSHPQVDPIAEPGLLPLDPVNPPAGPVAVNAVPLPPAAWIALVTMALAVACRNKLGTLVA